MFHLFSIPTYVALRWSMAFIIALLFLLVISIIDEKTLFQFFKIPILQGAIEVVETFLVANYDYGNWLFDKLMKGISQ